MNKVFLGFLSVLACSAAYALPVNETEVKVASVDPIYKTFPISQPRTRCWNEQTTAPNVGGYGEGHVVSQVAAGTLGHPYADNHTPADQNAVASVVGSSVAGQLHSREQYGYGQDTKYQSHCRRDEVTTYENRVVGYRVSYWQNGVMQSKITDYDPGALMKLNSGKGNYYKK